MWRLDAIRDPAKPTGWLGIRWLGTMTDSSEQVLNTGVIAVSKESTSEKERHSVLRPVLAAFT
jgi:hypothetical protein